jgi:signal transduction histidine kinase
MLRELRVRSYLVAPMLSRHRVLGTLTFANTGPGRRFSAEDVHIAEEVARRMVMAIESSRLYHEARAAVATRDQLLAVVSHDLRNHLSVITASTAILDEKLSSKEPMADRTIGALKRASAGMTRLVADLLDSAAIRAGQLSLDAADVVVDSFVRDVLEAHAPAAKAAHVHLKADLAAGDAEVPGDVHRLDQAIGNVLRNALLYCRAGDSVILRTRAKPSLVTIEIADTGPGIPPELVPELFNPYERGTRSPGGTGLGLFIAKGIIDRHGGTLEHERTDGGGATFCITLPRKAAG